MSLALQDPLIGTISLQEIAAPPGSAMFNGEKLVFQMAALVFQQAAQIATLSDPLVLSGGPIVTSDSANGTLYMALAPASSGYADWAAVLAASAGTFSKPAAVGDTTFSAPMSGVAPGTYYAWFCQINTDAVNSNVIVAINDTVVVTAFVPTPQTTVGTTRNSVDVTFDGAIASPGAVGDYALTQDGVPIALASVSATGSMLTITTTDTLDPVRTMSLTYTPGTLQGSGGQAVAGFTAPVTWTEKAIDPTWANQYSNKWNLPAGFTAGAGLTADGTNAAGAQVAAKNGNYATVDATKQHVIEARFDSVTTGTNVTVGARCYDAGGAYLGGATGEAVTAISASGQVATAVLTAYPANTASLGLYFTFADAGVVLHSDKNSLVELP